MRLHIIDGTFELFRSFYSKAPGHRTPTGFPAKATYGVIRSLISLLEDPNERVTHIAVAFDNPIESFRNELFDGYKTGIGIDPELRANFEPCEEAVEALGITVWRMDQWEADDALATAAVRWVDQVDQVRLMTPDKDMGQCLRGDQVVMVDRIRKTVTNEAAFIEKKGILPASVPDYLALVGDTADGIPGLRGWGAKSTSTVLHEYGSIESIPLDSSEWAVKVRGAQRLAETLREQLDNALLYRTLAELVTDVPLAENLDDLRWHGASDPFIAWSDAFGASGLAKLITRWV